MSIKDTLVHRVLDKGFKYLPEREIYIFNKDIITDEMTDKFFKLDMMVDDYHYKWLAYCFERIQSEIEDMNSLEDIDMDDIRDSIFEEIEPDCYTSGLTEWLNSKNSRVFYLTEALENFGEFKDGFQLLASAQQIEMEEVYSMGIEFIKWLIEECLNSEDEEIEESEEEEEEIKTQGAINAVETEI